MNIVEANLFANKMVWLPKFDCGKKKWILPYKKVGDKRTYVLEFDNPTLATATYNSKYNEYKNWYMVNKGKEYQK